MVYSVDAIRKRMDDIKAKTAAKSGGGKTKFKWFKVELGKGLSPVEKDIRFIMPAGVDGEPFYSVKIYDVLKDGWKKCYAPSSFGMPDLVAEYYEANRKDNWDIVRQLRGREIVYAYLLDRTAEDEGGQVFEMKADHRDKIYNQLTHRNFSKKNPFDAANGNDFTLKIEVETDGDGKPKMFGDKEKRPCKKLTFTGVVDPCPLSEDKARMKMLSESAPNFGEYFKEMVLTPDKLKQRLDEYIERAKIEAAEKKKDSKTTKNAKSSPKNEGLDHTEEMDGDVSEEVVKSETEDFFANTAINIK